MSKKTTTKRRLYNELDGVDYSYKLNGFSNAFVEDILEEGVKDGEPERANIFMSSIYNFHNQKRNA
jgi:hypothetical protein